MTDPKDVPGEGDMPCCRALKLNSMHVSVCYYGCTNVECASLCLQKVIDRRCVNFKVGEFK